MDKVEDIVDVILRDGHLIGNKIISLKKQDRPPHPIITKQYKNIHIGKLPKAMHIKTAPQIMLPFQKLIQSFSSLVKIILMF